MHSITKLTNTNTALPAVKNEIRNVSNLVLKKLTTTQN